MKKTATTAMEMAIANVENVNVILVMLESFVVAIVKNVLEKKTVNLFVMATENVTHVQPTKFRDVPAKLVGLEKIVHVQHLKRNVKTPFLVKYALIMANANVERVNVKMNSVENFARRKPMLFVRPWGLASWQKLKTLMTLTKPALIIMRRIDLAKTFINSATRQSKAKNQRRHTISMSKMQKIVIAIMAMLQLTPWRIALLW